MSGQDPFAPADTEQPPTPDQSPVPEDAPTPESAPTADEMSYYIPPTTDTKVWNEMRENFEHNEADRLNQRTAAMLPELPEHGGTQRRKVRVISQSKTTMNAMVSGVASAEAPPPPVEDTLSYDVRPDENEDQAFQRAKAAYDAIDAQASSENMAHVADATKYTAARAVSQMTLGLSSVAPLIGTQDFEHRYQAKYPGDTGPLEWSAAGAAVMGGSVKGLSHVLPMNAVFRAARMGVLRPMRNVILKGAGIAGDTLKPLAIKAGASLQDLMESRVGRELYQYVRPETLDRFHKAWTAAGATWTDDIVRVAEDQASNGEFMSAMRAWKSELSAAGYNVGKFRVMKVVASAAGGAAIGGTDAIVRAAGSDTPAGQAAARSAILPQALGGLFVGGAFGLAESLYNAGRVAFSPLEPAAAPARPKPSSAVELQEHRARQLSNRLEDIK